MTLGTGSGPATPRSHGVQILPPSGGDFKRSHPQGVHGMRTRRLRRRPWRASPSGGPRARSLAAAASVASGGAISTLTQPAMAPLPITAQWPSSRALQWACPSAIWLPRSPLQREIPERWRHTAHLTLHDSRAAPCESRRLKMSFNAQCLFLS